MSNEPTAQERELLEMLAEEAGEVVQAVTKILRHGWESYDPTLPPHRQITNRDHLSKEYVELAAIYDQLIHNHSVGNFNQASLHVAWQKKLRYTHHQQEAEEPKQPADHVNDVTVKWEEPGPINIIREQFEDWAKETFLKRNIVRSKTGYVNNEVDAAWSGWLAAERRKFDWPPQEEAPAAEPEPSPKKHWFAFTFAFKAQFSEIVSTSYIGWEEVPLFSKPLLNGVKKDAGMPENSTIVSIIPLGVGTREEFVGEGQ